MSMDQEPDTMLLISNGANSRIYLYEDGNNQVVLKAVNCSFEKEI